MDGFDTRLLGEPAEDPIMSLLSQQYGGQQAAAPVAQVAAPQYAPVSQAAQVSGDPQSLATLASRFQNELAQLGWTGGDPVIYDYTPGGESGQDFRATPVGVKPEFEQFLQGKNLQVALDPSGGGYRVSLLAGGQPIGQYQESQSGFERFMNVAQPLLVGGVLSMAVAGAIAPVLAAVPVIPASSVGALSRALAPTVVQAAATGDFNIEQAARNVVVNLVAPQIGGQVAAQVNDLYGTATGQVLSPAIDRAISNSVASAVATSIQQGADASDIGRNMIAGGVASAVTTTLRSVGLDPAVAAGIGRSAGSYVSTGSGTQAVVDGITRGLTFEQQRQAVADERAARANDPTAAQQPSTGSIEQSPAVQESGAAQDAGQLQTTGERGAGTVSGADVMSAIAQDRGVATTGGTQQLTTTAQRDQQTAAEPISGVQAGQAGTAQPVTQAADTGAAAPVTQVAPVGVTGARQTDTGADVVSGVQPGAGTGTAATGGIAAGGLGTAGAIGTGGTAATTLPPVAVTTAQPGTQNDEEQFARIGDLRPINVGPISEFELRTDQPLTFETAAGRIQEGPSEEEIYQQLVSERQPVTEPAPQPYGLVDRPSIPVRGVRETGAPRPEDLQTGVMQAGEPAPSIAITGARQPDRVDVTGQRISDQDIIDYISTDAGVAAEPAPAPAPAAAPVAAPAPAPSGGVTPTDIFSFVRRGRPQPMSVAQLAGMGYGMGRTAGLGGFTPAGELEPGGSAKPRQSVWNEASLRLKDALGL